MPLIKGKSPESFSKNVSTEMNAGKPQKQALAIAYSLKRRAKKMAEGGETQSLGQLINYPGTPKPQPSPRPMSLGGAVEEDDKDFNQHEVMPEDSDLSGSVDSEMAESSKDYSQLARLAMGGYAHGDIVDNVMRKRYSEGGRVANETPITAGFSPNEFDDLVLRDDLESTYGEDNNAGDALGNSREDQDRHDIVARIMRSRAKKDRNPRPA